ncbi:MAG TPA: hypothetical protein VG650_15370 [Mycobacteriales bacterium]|nr:hypothetical protein [Mycobacteriales bacterium]
MRTERVPGARRRALAMVGAGGALAASGFGLVPAATAATAHDTPVATSTGLNSSITSTTSTTGHKLYVKLDASHSDATAAPGTTDTLDVELANNKTIFGGESHTWSFKIPAGALTFDMDASGNADGNGTLDVPSSALSPFGMVSLKFAPKGSPTTQQCNGQPSSQTQPVTLSGTFYFDTKSKGSHKWGAIGSKTKKFTFSATNNVVTTYATTDFSCLGTQSAPCVSAISWFANHGGVSFDGSGQGSSNGSIFGSRSTNLSKPAAAIREDANTGVSKALKLKTKGSSTSLSVVGTHGTVGSATLKASKKQGPFSNPCKSGTEQITAWSNGSYKNGSSPLKLKMQIFGTLSLANNSGQSDGFEQTNK